MDLIVEITSGYTPADIEYLFHQVAQFAFEREYETGQDYRVTLDTFQQILPKVRPSLTAELIEELHHDSITYSRAWFFGSDFGYLSGLDRGMKHNIFAKLKLITSLRQNSIRLLMH